MSKPDTWMPLYIGDYLKDTTRLSTEQHGAYLLLIMDYWINGSLPDEDAALAYVTRLQPAAWKKNRPVISSFFNIEAGRWHHKRIDEERAKAVKFVEKQKANGAKGGRPKKTQSESQIKPMGFDRDNPNHNPDESPSPSPSPLTTSTKKSSGVDQLSSDTKTAGNTTRVGPLCKHLRSMGIDAAPHLPAWTDLVERFTNEQIIAVAKIAKERKPNERIHLHYLVTILNDPPKTPTIGLRRKPAAENFDNRDYGQGGIL